MHRAVYRAGVTCRHIGSVTTIGSGNDNQVIFFVGAHTR